MHNSIKSKKIRIAGFFAVLFLLITWEQRKFDYFFTERTDRSGDGELISVTINSGIKKFAELNRFDSKPEDMSNYKVVCEGDIAYNSMRMWQGASGYSPYNGILSPAYTVIVPKNGVSSKFFAYVLKRPKMIHLFEINSQGLTKDTWNLKFPAFSQIEATAPMSFDEQDQISTFLEQLDNLITLHQRKSISNILLSAIQKSIQKSAITWEQRKLGEVFDYERPDAYIVKSDKYSDFYSTPVLTANKGFILGYTDEHRVCNRECIIFDDFTLDSKYVTFPFMVKSSALKILTVKSGYYLPFAYKLLQATKIEVLGHARHYIGVVQFTKAYIPNNKEQCKIGGFLEQLDNLITLHQRKYFCNTLSIQPFSLCGCLSNFTNAWEQRKLGELAQITMGQSPDGTTYSETPSDFILVQGNADLENGWVKPRIWTTQKTKYAYAGDLIMSVRAPAGSMGKTAYDVVLGRGVAAIRGNEFIFQVLTKLDANGYWKKLSAGSTFESLNSNTIYSAEISYASVAEQKSLGDLFANIDNLITLHQRKLKIIFGGFL